MAQAGIGSGKDVEGNRTGPDLKVPSQHSPGATEKRPWKNLSQDGRFRAGFELTNLNSKPPESTVSTRRTGNRLRNRGR
jgi:hypothetical protein